MAPKGTTLVICTEGVAYRNVVNAGAINELKGKTNIVLVCAEWMLPFLQKQFPEIQLETVYLPSKYENMLDQIRMTRTIYPAAAYPDVNTTSLKIKRDRDVQKRPFHFYTRRAVAITLKLKLIQQLFKGLSWLGRKKPVKEVFDKHRVTSVFATNVLALEQLPYVEYAARHRIPVVSLVGSWDNLTSKGVPMYTPDALLMWGPKQMEESEQLHHMPEDILKIVGAPQFDPYFRNEIPSKEEMFRLLRIPENAKVITYLGGIPQNVMGLTAENEKVIVETILKGIDEGVFPKETILVIRPHPGVKDWTQYERFEKHEHVRMNYPEWYLKGKEPPKSWNPNWDDHLFMGSLMKHSDVVITPGGSSTLDASCFDTPSVNVNFDDKPRPYLESLKSHCDFDHLRYIRDYGASPFAESPEELLKEVREGLENPGKHSAGRKKLVEAILGFADGKSAERVAKEVLAFCQKSD